jgi:hypothetical protein
MNKEYAIKSKVWIHIGERKLVEGRVVEVIDLEHLKEGHRSDQELYVIELKTGIDDIYEVRTFDQISPDATGPINLFRKDRMEHVKNNRLLKKIGMPIPNVESNLLLEAINEINDELDSDLEPTAAEIHAAIDQSLKGTTHEPLNLNTDKPKRRYFKKKKA